MKNKNLKICFTIVMTLAACSIKAQSLHQKIQTDMQQRKNHADAVRLKAKEQQEQQKAEKTVKANIPQQPSAGNVIQTNNQPAPVQQKKEEIKPQNRQAIKKPVTTQQVPRKAAQY
jgi:hypothetical protein